MIKRYIMLITGMLVLFLGVAVYASGVVVTHFSYDFEDGNIPPLPWIADTIADNSSFGIGKAAKFSSGGFIPLPQTALVNNSDGTVKTEVSPENGKILKEIIEFDIMFDSAMSGAITLSFGQNYKDDESAYATQLIYNKDGYKKLIATAQTINPVEPALVPLIPDVKLGKWNRIRLEMQINSTLRPGIMYKKITFYCNGELIGLNEYKYASESADSMCVLDSVKIDGPNKVYIDNFVVHKATPDGNGIYLIDRGALLSKIYKSEDILNLEASKYEAESLVLLLEKLNHAKDVYNNSKDQFVINSAAQSLLSAIDNLEYSLGPIRMIGDYKFTDQDNSPVNSLKSVSEKLRLSIPVISVPIVSQADKSSIVAALTLYMFNDELDSYRLIRVASSAVKEFSEPNLQDQVYAELDMSPYTYAEKQNMFVRVFIWQDYENVKPLYDVSQQYSDIK